MYQTTFMCELVRRHGIADKKKLYRLYAEAERSGKIERRSNDHNLPPETYALTLLSYLKSRQHRGFMQALKDYNLGNRGPVKIIEPPPPSLHEQLLNLRSYLNDIIARLEQ